MYKSPSELRHTMFLTYGCIRDIYCIGKPEGGGEGIYIELIKGIFRIRNKFQVVIRYIPHWEGIPGGEKVYSALGRYSKW